MIFISLLGMVTNDKLATVNSEPEALLRYATWSGNGPDKWASVWLVERFISSGSKVVFVPENTSIDDAIMFDVPQSKFVRDGKQTTFDKLLSDYLARDSVRSVKDQSVDLLKSNVSQSDDQLRRKTLQQLKMILHDMEINTWQPNTLAISTIIEQAYRELQQDFQREAIPRQCYFEFFDRVYGLLLNGEVIAVGDTVKIKPQSGCAVDQLADKQQQSVREVSPAIIAQYMTLGKNIVFIDVREPQEFKEMHIPGAINIQIRNLDESNLKQLRSADLIVSYCVKDFRGYEMAAKIANAGLKNSVIMKPYGIKGWIDAGFPVYSGNGNEGASIEAMWQCMLDLSGCSATYKPVAVSPVAL